MRKRTGRQRAWSLPNWRRSGFQARLSPGVAMTSNVKGREQLCLGLHDVFYPLRIRRGGASKIRRLILLLSVGWVPPYLHPSGACLNLGTSIPVGSLNAAEGYTKPGLRLFSCTLVHLRNGFRTRTGSQKWSMGLYRVMGTSLAMAHTKPTSSRAMATVTTLACLPL